jgi:2-oxoisovalerate dehydrogenase E1 component
MFFEHKALYRSVSGEVPVDYYTLPFGKAAMLRSGKDVTIVTYGLGVHWALEVLNRREDISADLIDLRTLAPIDFDCIYSSVQKTGRVLVLHEDCLTGGIGGELSARITENCFEALDAPVMRCASLDTPVPFAGNLEKQFLANSTLESKLDSLLNY